MFTIDSHGGAFLKNETDGSDGELDPYQLAAWLMFNPSYTPGEPILLLGCQEGNSWSNGPSFAQQLSNITGSTVFASSMDVLVGTGYGDFGIEAPGPTWGPVPAGPGLNGFQPFNPQ
jgi:hypothetical protein